MQLIEDFIASLSSEKNLSLNSQLAYRRDLENFASFIKGNLGGCTSEEIRFYLKHLKQKRLLPATIARKLSSLRSFFKYLFVEKIRKDNPISIIYSAKKALTLPKAFTKEEVKSILGAVAKDHDNFKIFQINVLLHLLYATGMRVSELVNLKISQLPINLNNEFKENHFIIKGKGRRERVIFLSDQVIKLLVCYLQMRQKHYDQDCCWLFPYGKSGKPISRVTLYLRLASIAKSCGIGRIQASPHKFRHAFATHMLEAGADLRVIQELLGHSNINTTQIYTSVIDNKLREALFNSHPLAKKPAVGATPGEP